MPLIYNPCSKYRSEEVPEELLNFYKKQKVHTVSRVFSCLIAADHRSLFEVYSVSPRTMMKYRNFGKSCRTLLIELCDYLGLNWNPDGGLFFPDGTKFELEEVSKKRNKPFELIVRLADLPENKSLQTNVEVIGLPDDIEHFNSMIEAFNKSWKGVSDIARQNVTIHLAKKGGSDV